MSKAAARASPSARRSPGAPPARLSAAKSSAILREAMKLFLKKGYGAVSMNAIIARVGGSKTTVYARYRNKAELFAAAIDGLLSAIVDSAATSDVTDLSVAAALMQIARSHLAAATSPRYIRLIRVVAAEVERFPELGRTFYEHGPGRSYAAFTAWLKRQHQRGTLTITNPKLATDHFFGTLLHRRTLIRLYGLKQGPPGDLEAVAREVAGEFLAAYGKPSPTTRRTSSASARP